MHAELARIASGLCVLLFIVGCQTSGADQDSGPVSDVPPRDTARTDTVTGDAPVDSIIPDTGADAFQPLPGFGHISGPCGVLNETQWSNTGPFRFRNAISFGTGTFDPSLLSAGGLQIWTEGNRGGDSVSSEIFAHELLHRCELATLLKTETKILYGDASGKKTDLLLQIDGRKIGVSVTRAYHYPPTTLFTVAEARSLLEKKLADLPLSQSNALPADAWVRSMLHVLVYDAQYGDAIQDAWDNEIDAQLKGDAILFITVTNGDDSFIY